MCQIRGVQREAVVRLLRALDNNGDGVSSAFPSGKQNEDYFHILYFTDMSIIRSEFLSSFSVEMHNFT